MVFLLWCQYHCCAHQLLSAFKAMILNLPNAAANTVPYVMETPTIKVFSFLLHNCDFDAGMNCSICICVFWWS